MPPQCALSRAALSGAELRDAGAAAASPKEPGWVPGAAAPASPRPAEGPGNGRKEKLQRVERRGAGRVQAPPVGAAEPRRYLPPRRGHGAARGAEQPGERSPAGSRAARGADEGGPEPAALPRPPPLPAPALRSTLLPRREKGQRCPNKAIGSQELLPKITPRSPASASGPFYEGGKRHSPPYRPSVRPPRPGQGSRRRTGWESKCLLKIERAWEGGASLPPRCPAGRTGSRPGSGGNGRGSREPRPGAMSRAERSRGAAPGLPAPGLPAPGWQWAQSASQSTVTPTVQRTSCSAWPLL